MLYQVFQPQPSKFTPVPRNPIPSGGGSLAGVHVDDVSIVRGVRVIQIQFIQEISYKRILISSHWLIRIYVEIVLLRNGVITCCANQGKVNCYRMLKTRYTRYYHMISRNCEELQLSRLVQFFETNPVFFVKLCVFHWNQLTCASICVVSEPLKEWILLTQSCYRTFTWHHNSILIEHKQPKLIQSDKIFLVLWILILFKVNQDCFSISWMKDKFQQKFTK